jgi:prefoldin subunit 5
MMKYDYDVEALRENVQKCKKNIDTFEQAIQAERDTIAQYRHMIEVLEQKAAIEKGITIDANSIN